MKTILVLGGSGFIGNAIVNRLLRSYNVIVIDKVAPNVKYNNENFKYIVADLINSMQGFEDVLKNVDKVLHLISTTVPVNSTDKILQGIQENVFPTIQILDLMVKCGIREIIFASSAGTVYGESSKINYISDVCNPISSYGIEKITIEAYIKLYTRYHGIKGKIVRFSNPYGMDKNSDKEQGAIPIFIRKNLNKEAITLYGDTTRDYIYIDDLIEGLFKVIEYDGNQDIFQICFGKSYLLHEILNFIEEILKQKFVKVNRIDRRICDVKDSLLDATETNKELQWRAETDLYDGIKKTVEKIKQINTSCK